MFFFLFFFTENLQGRGALAFTACDKKAGLNQWIKRAVSPELVQLVTISNSRFWFCDFVVIAWWDNLSPQSQSAMRLQFPVLASYSFPYLPGWCVRKRCGCRQNSCKTLNTILKIHFFVFEITDYMLFKFVYIFSSICSVRSETVCPPCCTPNTWSHVISCWSVMTLRSWKSSMR